MKACVGLLDGPEEFGLVDDDLFVLDPVDDALEAFGRHDLVFIPDCDHAREYHRTWGAVFRQSAGGALQRGALLVPPGRRPPAAGGAHGAGAGGPVPPLALGAGVHPARVAQRRNRRVCSPA